MNEPGLIAELAETHAERTAVVVPGVGSRTFRAFNENIEQIRGRLAACTAPGDVVAIVSANRIEFLEVYFACLRAGLAVVTLNPNLRERELIYILEDAGACLLVADPRFARLADAALEGVATGRPKLLSIGPAAGVEDITGDFCKPDGAERPCDTLGCPLIYSSATTGRPKGIVTPLRSAYDARLRAVELHAAMYRAAGIAPCSDGIHLCSSQLYHATPLDCASIALELGHTVVLLSHWTPEAFLSAVDRYRVSSAMMVPTMFVRLLKLEPSKRLIHDVSSLKFVSHGCAPCSREIKRRMLEWFGPVIWEMYGASEGSGTVAGPQEWLARPGTVGKAMPGGEVAILDDAGVSLPPNAVGNVYMRRYTGETFEYRGDAAKTRAAHVGSFFTAGDIGYVDQDGYLFLCGRKNEVIISAGQNIYPAEIETCAVEHRFIADCAVIARPDEILGEVPVAYVELAAESADEPDVVHELMVHLATQLAPYKLPRRIHVVRRLPRDPAGKLFKRQLSTPQVSLPGFSGD